MRDSTKARPTSLDNCGSNEHYKFKKRSGLRRCKPCGADYTATSGTPFASSKLPEAKRALLVATITASPTLSAQKVADACGVSMKTAWLWKSRVLNGDGAAKGYFQGSRQMRGKTKTVWEIRHADPWPAARKEVFTSMWKRGCPIKCMAAMFAVEPGSISSRAKRQGLTSRRAA